MDETKPLLLRHNAHDPANHYQVYRGADGVGTIYQAVNVGGDNCWFWALNGAYAGPQPMSGWAESREAAMTAVRAAWDRRGDGVLSV